MSKDTVYECKICIKERAKDSEICPHCGTKEAHWSVYLSKWFWALLIVGGIYFFEKETEVFSRAFYKFIYYIYS
jgi:RNA polymerase subunit RPABC4/transcription elongation factor Spt4